MSPANFPETSFTPYFSDINNILTEPLKCSMIHFGSIISLHPITRTDKKLCGNGNISHDNMSLQCCIIYDKKNVDFKCHVYRVNIQKA